MRQEHIAVLVKIGELQGEAKFHQAMNGSMWPQGIDYKAHVAGANFVFEALNLEQIDPNEAEAVILRAAKNHEKVLYREQHEACKKLYQEQ